MTPEDRDKILQRAREYARWKYQDRPVEPRLSEDGESVVFEYVLKTTVGAVSTDTIREWGKR